MVAGLSYRFKEQHDQEDIDDMLQIIDLIVKAYSSLNDNYLFKLSKNEKKIKLEDSTKLQYIMDELFEAEKVLHFALSQEQMLKYRGLISAFKERNKEYIKQ